MSNLAPLTLPRVRTSSNWLQEPDLSFAGGATHPDPKVGIPLYGPRSFGTPRHKEEVHIGFIGTSEAVEHARAFYENCSVGVAGDEDHPPFPGCMKDRGFKCDLRMDAKMIELITRTETLDLLGIRRSRERFETTMQILRHKTQLLAGRDHPLDYIVLVLPNDLYRKCRVANYRVKDVGPVHRDLRRAYKAMAMQFHKPTQILQETTTRLSEDTGRKLDHESLVAWNLFTGLYFKADGLPWGPTGLPPGTCFVGISFYRPLGETSTLRTSVVQAFDEDGEGLVLRGHSFHWDEAKERRSPHLTEELAGRLTETILERYKDERKQTPQRVIIQKTSRFEPAERKGFEQALSRVGRYDLMALSPDSASRLVRAGQYPPLRGTNFQVGDISYLYTTGYLSLLGRYPHGHVPSPLQISDHVGDTATPQLLREMLTLTKMNWNSADYASSSPITIRFSQQVGEILREVPELATPQPKFKALRGSEWVKKGG
jgi:hypothetical protein